MGLTYKEIATRLQIGVGTAHRLYEKYVLTGDVAPQKQPERPDSRKLDNTHLLDSYMRTQPSISMKSVLKFWK